MKAQDKVSHKEFGTGTVQSVNGSTVKVLFDSGLTQIVDKSTLSLMLFS